MSIKAVVGVYDSLAKAEEGELHLEAAHLPLAQMSLLAPKMDDGQVEGDITARGVAEAVAGTGIRLDPEQVDEYERVLQGGEHLLIFVGDVEQVAQAYEALGHTDYDELTELGG